MHFIQSMARLFSLMAAATAGILDATAKGQIIRRQVAGPLIVGCLLLMFGCASAASRNHRNLVFKTLFAQRVSNREMLGKRLADWEVGQTVICVQRRLRIGLLVQHLAQPLRPSRPQRAWR